MANDHDELFTLLTPTWDDVTRDGLQHSNETRHYLAKLTSLSLAGLLKEPAIQREERQQLTENAQKIAFREYPAFLHVQENRKQLEESLQQIDAHLDHTKQLTPDLKEACQMFSQHAKTIVQERTKITQVLEHNDILTDIFEIPQLMDTCVRNRYYNDALKLASHVRLLLLEYPLPVIRSIQQKVQSSTDLMLVQLLSQLRGPIKLAAVTEVIFYLRRMDVFTSDAELPMVFLRCRHDFLEQKLGRIKSKQLPQSSRDVSAFAKDYVSLMREQMMEIANQYTSVFPPEKTPLLSDYVVHLITQMQTTLDDCLQKIDDPSKLKSLHTQLKNSGVSLGRIGLDFQPLFSQLFESRIITPDAISEKSPINSPTSVPHPPDSPNVSITTSP